MKSFLSGTVFGLIVGGGLVYWAMQPDELDTPAESSASDATGQYPAKASGDTRVERPVESAPAQTQTAPVASVSSSASFPSQTPKSFPTPLPQAEMPASPAVDGTAPPRDPIPMHDSVRSMLATLSGGTEIAQKHAALEQEPRDDSWSYYMEQMLASYFAVRAPQVGVEIVGIACRSTACEIQAIDTSEMPAALSGLLGAATKESWWDFNQMNARSSTHQGRAIAIVFLNRGKKTATK